MARAAEVGVEARLVKLERSTTQEQLERKIRELNADDSVDGIIVQVRFLLEFGCTFAKYSFL
jgi:5,10-methylene-tetrahydrofolate dehydrogenase/methenyl tetrahydrofolate cyclohydrolase